MIEQMLKRVFILILAAVLCITLSGCSVQRSAETEPVLELPEPSTEPVQRIFGEQVEPVQETVSLYYISGDGTSFSTVSRSMTIAPGESLLEEAVNELLYGTVLPERTSYMLPEVRLLGIEYACGIATVHLSIDVHSITGRQEYLMLIAAITNTLLSIEGVDGVNILVGDQTESIFNLPVGVQTVPFVGITPAYAQFNAENDYFLESETGTITRNAALYFPDTSGNRLIPELREITFDGSNYASALIRALRLGPQSSRCTISAMPESADLLLSNPVISTTSSGERVLMLDFAPTLLSYLALSGVEEWKMIGSITLTLCSFIPEIDAVQIFVDGEPLTDCRVGGKVIPFEDGLIRRSDFADFISGAVELCIPNENGTLDAVERAETMMRTQSPLSLLYALFDEILSRPNSALLFPVNVYHSDILGVSVSDQIASVNLSANFYRQCQALNAVQERGVIYSFVNTLCELDSISGVRFYIEGISAETLAGNIYLKGTLLPNPGLMAADKEATSPETTEEL